MRTSLDLRDDVKLLTYIYNLSWEYSTKETAQKKDILISSQLIPFKNLCLRAKARKLRGAVQKKKRGGG